MGNEDYRAFCVEHGDLLGNAAIRRDCTWHMSLYEDKKDLDFDEAEYLARGVENADKLAGRLRDVL